MAHPKPRLCAIVAAGALVLAACHHGDRDDAPPPAPVATPVVAPTAPPTGTAPPPTIAPVLGARTVPPIADGTHAPAAGPTPPTPALVDTAQVEDVSEPAGAARAEPPPPPLTSADRAQARQCTMDADHACVVRLLAGRAETESDYAMLIEACRASGQRDPALRYMRVYLEKFPSRPRARGYQQILAREG